MAADAFTRTDVDRTGVVVIAVDRVDAGQAGGHLGALAGPGGAGIECAATAVATVHGGFACDAAWDVDGTAAAGLAHGPIACGWGRAIGGRGAGHARWKAHVRAGTADARVGGAGVAVVAGVGARRRGWIVRA
jgi:hypothetical protein